MAFIALTKSFASLVSHLVGLFNTAQEKRGVNKPTTPQRATRTTSLKRDTVSYGTALAWTLLLPVWKAFTSTRNQIYASDTSRNPLQSSLVFHLILDLLLKISFWANFYLSFYIILSYLAKSSIQRNMNRRGEKRLGAGREKSPSFTKITKEMVSQNFWFNNRGLYTFVRIWLYSSQFNITRSVLRSISI